MNKFVFVVAMLAAGSAFARTPVPPKRPAELTAPAPIFNTDPNVYGAIVKDGQVLVRAPLGTDMQVDVDGNTFSVDVDGARKSPIERVLPWNWFK